MNNYQRNVEEIREIIKGIPKMEQIGDADESTDGSCSYRYCNGWNDCLRFVKKTTGLSK